MQLVQATRDALLKPLSTVAGIVERRNTLPILANILLRKDGKNVAFIATDLEVHIKTHAAFGIGDATESTTDRTSDVSGKTVSVLVVFGGSWFINKKKNSN